MSVERGLVTAGPEPGRLRVSSADTTIAKRTASADAELPGSSQADSGSPPSQENDSAQLLECPDCIEPHSRQPLRSELNGGWISHRWID